MGCACTVSMWIEESEKEKIKKFEIQWTARRRRRTDGRVEQAAWAYTAPAHSESWKKNKKLTRAFLREDRARDKHWRRENSLRVQAAKCAGRVPNASWRALGVDFSALNGARSKNDRRKKCRQRVQRTFFTLKKIRAPQRRPANGRVRAATSVKWASWVSTRPVRCVYAKNENRIKK